jgi:uncharacterized protein YndB with AHSA1/START domain
MMHKIVSAQREIAAPAATIFELIADPARQPEWDGNNNLDHAETTERVRGVGDMFAMRTVKGNRRENHVVEFVEGRLIAWMPAEPGGKPLGHLWRWQLTPLDSGGTLVTHTYDWTQLTDENRFAQARWTTSERLQASIDRLAAVAESAPA